MALFITFEGIDRCGKTTQHRLLSGFFEEKGMPCYLTREPGGVPLAEKIRHILLDPINEMRPMTELLLYMASRYEHLHQLILPKLQAGVHVLSDRFIDSSLVYQGVVRELGVERVRQLHQLTGIDRVPDQTFIIDIPPEVSEERIRQLNDRNRMECFSLSQVTRLRDAYLMLAAENPGRFNLINGQQPIEIIQQEIRRILEEQAGLAEKKQG